MCGKQLPKQCTIAADISCLFCALVDQSCEAPVQIKSGHNWKSCCQSFDWFCSTVCLQMSKVQKLWIPDLQDAWSVVATIQNTIVQHWTLLMGTIGDSNSILLSKSISETFNQTKTVRVTFMKYPYQKYYLNFYSLN